MSAEQYWDGDCRLTVYYRKAAELQRERQNEALWLQGMYIYEALCDVSPVLHAFAKKGSKPLKYAEKPYAITTAEVERRKEEKEKAISEKIKAKMSAFAVNFNARMKKEKEAQDE